MSLFKRNNQKKFKGIICLGLCFLAVLPMAIVHSSTLVKDRASLVTPTLLDLKLRFGKNEHVVQMSSQELYKTSEQVVDNLIENESKEFTPATGVNGTQENQTKSQTCSDQKSVCTDRAQKVAKDYVDMNLKNGDVPSADNVDDYLYQVKTNFPSIPAQTFEQDNFKNQSQIVQKYFDGEKLVFDGAKFSDFEKMRKWNIPISELILKVDNAFSSALIVTISAATLTAVSVVLGYITAFSLWSITTSIGLLAFEYLLCTALLYVIKCFLTSFPESTQTQTLSDALKDKRINAGRAMRWLNAGMRVCSILIELSKYYVWVPLISVATDQLYNFAMAF